MTTPKTLRNLLFSLLLLAFFRYAYRYIESTAFQIGGEKYYVLFDDAMISMRYAYNWAHRAWDRFEMSANAGKAFQSAVGRVHGARPPAPHPARENQPCHSDHRRLLLAATLYFVRLIVELFTDDLPAMLAAVRVDCLLPTASLVGSARYGSEPARN